MGSSYQSGITRAAADARYLELDGTGSMAAPIVFTGAPTISGAAGGITVGLSLAGAASFQLENEDGRNPIFSYVSVSGAKTFTLPNATGVFVLDTATQTLTNKTLTDPIFGGSAKFKGLTTSAAGASTTELPADKDFSLHKNTGSGAVHLAYNDGGVIKSVALA